MLQWICNINKIFVLKINFFFNLLSAKPLYEKSVFHLRNFELFNAIPDDWLNENVKCNM